MLQAIEICIEKALSVLEQQNEGCIGAMLAGVAPMDELRRRGVFSLHSVSKSLDEWKAKGPPTKRLTRKNCCVEILRPRGIRDGARCGLWNDLQLSFGASKCDFEIEERLKDGAV